MTVPARSVCLDVQAAQNLSHFDRGIPRFVIEHALALVAHDEAPFHSVLMNPGLPLTGNLGPLVGRGLLAPICDTTPKRDDNGSRPCVYHVMSPFELDRPLSDLWPEWARSPRVQTVVTLYDLIPMIFDHHYLIDPSMRERYLTRARLVRSAAHVFAISQSTADDAVERLQLDPRRVTVIDAGASELFASLYTSRANAEQAAFRQTRGLRPGFMLYVAGFEFRKNLHRLIQAYGLLAPEVREAHQLVIVCRLLDTERELLGEWAAEAGIAPGQLILTGYVTDLHMAALYHACRLFIFASFYEGSGLPILEAMSCGAPVIASNTSTSPEILGDLEGTFNPLDPTSIADCIAEFVVSDEALQRLRERSRRRVGGYTWRHVAERTFEGYEALAEEARVRRRIPSKPRPSLAFVSPWPPEQSGIADHTYRLTQALSSRADIDIVVSEELEFYAPPVQRGMSLTDIRAFKAGIRRYDRILYCMGNSSFHRCVHDLLPLRRGAVLAHDVRLTGFYGWLGSLEDTPEEFRDYLRRQYGSRLPERLINAGLPDYREQANLGVFMTTEIQSLAEELFVHSRFAREVLELDRGDAAIHAPIHVMPHGIPDVPARKQAITVGDEPWIVSVGLLSEVKGLEQLISAYGILASEHPGARLMLAGPAEEHEARRWRDYAREHAPDGDVRILGHLDDSSFYDLLVRADLAVQLRTMTNGEASGAVSYCMAVGLPTIVTDLGWSRELPREAVSAVSPAVSAHQLAERMSCLLTDMGRRQQLHEASLEHAAANSFEVVAELYLHALQLD